MPPSLPRIQRSGFCGSIHIVRKSPNALANRLREFQLSPVHVLPPSSELSRESLFTMIRLSLFWSTRI